MHYINTLKQELSGTKAYEQTSEKEKSVINNHILHNATRVAVSVNEDQERLPTFYWLEMENSQYQNHLVYHKFCLDKLSDIDKCKSKNEALVSDTLALFN